MQVRSNKTLKKKMSLTDFLTGSERQAKQIHANLAQGKLESPKERTKAQKMVGIVLWLVILVLLTLGIAMRTLGLNFWN